ncbi:putative Pyrophosphate-energized vacuolar membrane proton pump [Blattamonas nauphoetae]|uniref:H(+)-exporting diphosphatase n=1 Tax=Blattamonas nauphoetae TaxID=2049346 RepID=A0ABQ9XBB7_9EUKA|nr:putative Pyrophosphate-energized vacuolar membrane proton pump [Blattamonas nauphoetae]
MASTEAWVWGFLAVVLLICIGCAFYVVWLYKWVMKHPEGPDEMKAVSDPIREGAFGFLNTQYKYVAYISIPVALFILLIYGFVPGSTAGILTKDGTTFGRWTMGIISTIAFLLGALCSGFSGYMGMWVSVRTNVRCAAAAITSSNEAIKVALRGGAFSGMLIVTLSLFGVGSMFAIVHAMFGNVKISVMSNVIVGYGFGASFVALFAQLGGGIYTKAADVGCDLVGKVNNNIPEDDPRNPAVVADLVGDNVGDCAGRGADLFESTAAENIGAMVIGGQLAEEHGFDGRAMAGYILFPLVVRGFGLCCSMIGILCVYSKEKHPEKKEAPKSENPSASFGDYATVDGLDDEEDAEDPLFGLIRGFSITSACCAVLIFLASYMCLDNKLYKSAWLWYSICGLVGIAMSLCFVFITQYYTDYRYRPVMSVAKASESGHATNIIAGLAVGMESTALPVLVIVISIVACYKMGEHAVPNGGYFGTACGTMGMLMVVAFVLAMDTFGPIADNAGGIVEMSEQPEYIRRKTDRLDAVGNTTKALTKGYAVGSAALATFLLFSAFLDTVKLLIGDPGHIAVDLGTPEVFSGGLIGGMLVYLFSAWAIDAVGNAAQEIIAEVNRQFTERPGILNGTEKPDYQGCVSIVTRSALREMVRPALLVVLTPVVVGLTFRLIGIHSDPILGARVLGGLLMVATITGVLLGLFLNNGGGAWDNAKKYIEMGNYGGKGSEAHKASVTGDTVGDPCKDTAGPSIHVLIKLLSTITLVLAPIFVKPNASRIPVPEVVAELF